ncbi:hypothetical protein [Rheinheimera nanhaiensis]|uniref:hypothetical protein n=1 Tax=Rheinheimera nanhaiensis TaxID=1163621 RepID=UPI00058BB75C|nr:hypothetical protein [Rheinheimera nanhaiensis]
MFDLNEKRTAKDVIDDAIRENNSAAWLLYGFAIVFVLVGLAILVIGLLNNNDTASILGTVASIMFWPAMSAARKTRRENIAIRLLEAPLSQSSTSIDAAAMLHHLVEKILNDDKGDGK